MQYIRKSIVVTGASRGIGAALVNAYAAHGDEVIAVARSLPKASRSNIQPLAADLATDAGIARLVSAIEEWGQGVDILINNAGIQNEIALTGFIESATIDAEIALNLASPIKLSLALMPFLRGAGSTVVNVTSLVALHPKPSAPVYSATKAGLSSFTRALRHQMSGKGIAVVEVVPPVVATDMTAGRGHGKLSPEDMAAAIIAGVAQGATLVAPGKSRLVMRLNRFLPGLVARLLAKE
jgi:uncharacterized oxidoreductase